MQYVSKNITALRAKAHGLREAHAQLQDRMRQLNENEVKIAGLRQEVELAAASLQKYTENFEQARIDRALDHDRISNVNIYQHASLESRPVSPRRGIVLVLGMLTALLGGVLAIALGEYWDNSLATPTEVEEELQLAVLVSVPHTQRTPVLV